MKNSISLVLGFTTIALLTQEQPARANTTLAQDAEDSPLYAVSMRNSLADMAARDRGLLTPPEASRAANPGLDNIIAVEGGKWHILPAGAKDPGPRPLGVTTEVTCTGNPTCGMVITCQIIGKTCQSYPTCAGNETCTWTVTCNNTCTFYPTCSGSGQPTCWGATCVTRLARA